jgi:penicillin amidase
LTIFETDAEDMYVYDLLPGDPLQYRYKDGWRKMEVIRERFHIKNGKDTLIDLYFTHHGPVTFIDHQKNKAVAIRCAWLEPGGAPYLASLRMDQSTNWDEFREACSFNHIPGENMVWADRKGNIGWQAVGITPIRKSHSGMVPVPGNGEYEWQGFLPIKERPHLLNPSRGFFATANQHVTPSSYPFKKTISYTWADAFRGDRVNEVLQASNKATIDDSKELQCDYTSLPARVLVPLLRSLSFNDPMEIFAKGKLLQWDLILDTSSVAAAIYIMWEREISAMAEKRFVPPSITPFISLQLTRILQWLMDPSIVFHERPSEERDTFLRECFQSAIKKLRKKLGEDVLQWRYGQPLMKHIEIRHPLSQWVDTALRRKLDFGPVPRGGYGLTPGATGMADNQTVGASFRFIADLSDWDKAVIINTPGQSGDPASPFYGNLFKDWANDQYFPALFTKKKILTHLHVQTKLFPAGLPAHQ